MIGFRNQRAACALTLLVSASTAIATPTASNGQKPGTWPTDIVARLEAAALLQTLNVELLTNDNTERTLGAWCVSHRLSTRPTIATERVSDAEEIPTEVQRKMLAASTKDSVRHIKVRVLCGSVVLLEADNWYLPARISPQWNASIERTEWPLEAAVQTGHFRRRILSASLLWPPLPELKELASGEAQGRAQSGAVQPLPARVLAHHLLVLLPDGAPFGEVEENYTGGVLPTPYPNLLPEIIVMAKRIGGSNSTVHRLTATE